MSRDARKLTVHLGERDRAGERFLADRLIDLFEAHRLAISVLMRGAEGFGTKQHLRTDRLLTLSEDLPVVAVAVDGPDRIDPVVDAIAELRFDGLVTVERAQLAGGGRRPTVAAALGAQVKLTLYLGRGRRSGGRPAYERAVEALHDHGVAGATVLLGVDGTVAGERRRGRFFSRNDDVPAVVVSVGERERIAAALPELDSLLDRPPTTLERVRVLKRDGRLLAELDAVPGSDRDGLERRVKLTLYSAEQNRFEERPAHVAAVRALRSAGAPGATALRGVWGYHGSHDPHGDRLWSLRRRGPTVTSVIDEPRRARSWLGVLDRVTPERGLITAEIVPAFRATAPGVRIGGLRLAAPVPGAAGDRLPSPGDPA